MFVSLKKCSLLLTIEGFDSWNDEIVVALFYELEDAHNDSNDVITIPDDCMNDYKEFLKNPKF